MAAPKTVKTYPLDGTTRDFEIPFEYLARKFVVVTLIGQDRKQLVLNIDYRFTQRTIITLTRNWSPSEGYSLIEIKRVTSATERLVDFSDGSILRASDLNTSTVQALHIAEEGRDIATDTIGVDNNGQLDARGRQIKNLADGVDDFDAVNYRQLKQFDTSTLNNANRAETKANEAAASAVAANNSRQLAENAQVNTYAARDVAVSARDTAVSARDSAGGYRDEARLWAAAAEDLPVTGSFYSSYHYSRKAAASAASAASSQSVATTQADRAKTEADRAKTEADKLGNMNQLAGAIQGVDSSFKVDWKGSSGFHGGRVEVTNTANTASWPGYSIRDVASGYRWLIGLDPQANMRFQRGDGVIALTLGYDGSLSATNAMVAGGNIFSNGGSIHSRAQEGGNAHFWMLEPNGNERALIYADASKVMHMRAGQSGNEWRINTAGSFLSSQGHSLEQDMNIRSNIYRGGTLHNDLNLRGAPAESFDIRLDIAQPALGQILEFNERIVGRTVWIYGVTGSWSGWFSVQIPVLLNANVGFSMTSAWAMFTVVSNTAIRYANASGWSQVAMKLAVQRDFAGRIV